MDFQQSACLHSQTLGAEQVSEIVVLLGSSHKEEVSLAWTQEEKCVRWHDEVDTNDTEPTSRKDD